MSMRPTSCLVALALLNAGCSLVSDSVHVIGYRTRRALDDSRELHRDRGLADAAWSEVGSRTPGLSADYGDGFKEGFAAHLFRGTCEPPPLPPARYRTVRNQTLEGYRAAEQWLNGFRHGVAEAHNRGLRDLVTGPSAFRTAEPPELVPASSVPLMVPPPQPEPGAPTAAVVTASAIAPAATAGAVYNVLPRESPPQSLLPTEVVAEPAGNRAVAVTAVPAPPQPPRMTMQQLVWTRLAVGTVTPVFESGRPSPRGTDELTPHWTSNSSPDSGNIWWRSDG